jgi:hypothetical protein
LKTLTKRYVLFIVVALAAALQGCGGGSTQAPEPNSFQMAAPKSATMHNLAGAFDGLRDDSLSSDHLARRGTKIPARPGHLQARSGDSQVQLTWSAARGALSYTVKRATVSGGPYGSVFTGLTATAFTDTGLVNGTSYFYVVSAENASGESPNSPEVSATPVGTSTVPAAPAGLAAVPGDTAVTLTWNAVVGASSYRIYRNSTLGGLTSSAGFIDRGLANGTTYTYQVSAINAAGEGPYSSSVSATPASSGSIPAAGTYVRPGTVGYLGDPSALTQYVSGGTAPDGCSWQSYGLRCDQTDLVLDHVYISGGLYWTGTGDLTITNSIIEGGNAWYVVYAAAATNNAGATMTVQDSTLRWGPGSVVPSDVDVGPFWTHGTQAMIVQRCDISGMPQGLDPGANSLIEDTWIHDLFQNNPPSTPTHLDGLFSQGGGNIVIRRNYIDAPVRSDTTAALFIQNRTGTDAGIKIYANYLSGGAYALRNQTGIDVDVVNNTFGGNLYGDVGDLTGYPGTYGAWSGNTHGDGSIVPRP